MFTQRKSKENFTFSFLRKPPNIVTNCYVPDWLILIVWFFRWYQRYRQNDHNERSYPLSLALQREYLAALPSKSWVSVDGQVCQESIIKDEKLINCGSQVKLIFWCFSTITFIFHFLNHSSRENSNVVRSELTGLGLNVERGLPMSSAYVKI